MLRCHLTCTNAAAAMSSHWAQLTDATGTYTGTKPTTIATSAVRLPSLDTDLEPWLSLRLDQGIKPGTYSSFTGEPPAVMELHPPHPEFELFPHALLHRSGTSPSHYIEFSLAQNMFLRKGHQTRNVNSDFSFTEAARS
eukprot:g42688.t1